MLTETGRVVAVEADGLWVETLRKSTCGSCTARSGCGHGLMNRLGEGRSSYIRVLPGEGDIAACKIDDEVRIGIPEELLLRGSLMVYVLPLLGLLGGASLGASLLPLHSDLATLAGAAAGFLASLGIVRLHSLRHRDDARMQPTLLEVLPAGDALRWSDCS